MDRRDLIRTLLSLVSASESRDDDNSEIHSEGEQQHRNNDQGDDDENDHDNEGDNDDEEDDDYEDIDEEEEDEDEDEQEAEDDSEEQENHANELVRRALSRHSPLLQTNITNKELDEKYTSILETDFKVEKHESTNVYTLLGKRESEPLRAPLLKRSRLLLSYRTIPNRYERTIYQVRARAFCGKFSEDGQKFMCASQENSINIYDTTTWQLDRQVLASEINYSIIDTDFSPSKNFVAYTTWSNYAYLADIRDEQVVSHFVPIQQTNYHFCIFSIKFSPNSKEIIAGCNDGNIYIYDLERQASVAQVNAHRDDVNSVCFSSYSANMFFSGSDDCVCKVWDRRSLQSDKPQGHLVGHTEGITHVSSRGDDTYLLSNGKDQQIKLWDVRMLTQTLPRIQSTSFDYRWGNYARPMRRNMQNQDLSVKSFSGHRVSQTLIRAYFSPVHTTGQRYIYSGSADGYVYVYDTIDSSKSTRFKAHNSIVRDVSWHPYDNMLATTSWDGKVMLWH
eukprot:TRINITY_DN1776_c0_g1_i2.p1 TRINITY_DN1776_c0_g1~~TRINITY_DN1776_c0_g1_i2.p1  ORF type:complete len:506 (-),score=102.65 TRINITY_DN1776_c0_g1_i2:228-1745(-)